MELGTKTETEITIKIDSLGVVPLSPRELEQYQMPEILPNVRELNTLYTGKIIKALQQVDLLEIEEMKAQLVLAIYSDTLKSTNQLGEVLKESLGTKEQVVSRIVESLGIDRLEIIAEQGKQKSSQEEVLRFHSVIDRLIAIFRPEVTLLKHLKADLEQNEMSQKERIKKETLDRRIQELKTCVKTLKNKKLPNLALLPEIIEEQEKNLLEEMTFHSGLIEQWLFNQSERHLGYTELMKTFEKVLVLDHQTIKGAFSSEDLIEAIHCYGGNQALIEYEKELFKPQPTKVYQKIKAPSKLRSRSEKN